MGSAPNLQKLAIKIFGQISSSSGSERKWNVIEPIHTKKNRLEHQWLNELVNVHYNLRLKNRQCFKSFNYVPIDYESVDELESWIIEEEEQPTIVYEDLENIL